MKKIVILLLLLVVSMKNGYPQLNINQNTDSLKQLLLKAKEDTNKVRLYAAISLNYVFSLPDSGIYYAKPGLKLAEKLGFINGRIYLLHSYSVALGEKGNYPQSLQLSFEALKLAEKTGDLKLITMAYHSIGDSYFMSGDFKTALIYWKKLISKPYFSKEDPARTFCDLGWTYLKLNKLDSALIYTRKAYEMVDSNGSRWPVPGMNLGNIYEKLGDHKNAVFFSLRALKMSSYNNDLASVCLNLATIYKNMGKIDSSVYYARRSLNISLTTHILSATDDAANLLMGFYRARHMADSALKYQDIMLAARDSMFNRDKITQEQNFDFNEKMRQQDILRKQAEYRNNVKMYVLLAVVSVFILIAFLLWRNNRHKQAANARIQKMLDELRSTQSQLIQREKMASLGELTAGIAHEIQNPLNFVNNFSEVSVELLGELKGEAVAGNTEDVIAIADDLTQNLEKIRHHGKRADSIVKGMLEHSRASTGQKEPTDLNALADEYLRLAYHGLRAKDKNFNADLITHFDENLPNANVVAQDMGRVLINLFNNAFYAVKEKAKTAGPNYKPTVQVTTYTPPSGGWGVSVRDNGDGIPDAVKDKIMQPFFTTKPTGEGTGLGLSLSYDIVVKGHGGTININSREGDGAEFVITLPM